MKHVVDGGSRRNASAVSLRSGYCRVSAGSLSVLAVAVLTVFSAALHAEETVQTSCTKGDLVRRIAVLEHSLSSGRSCEVVYQKESEAPGEHEVLWTAKQDAGYCYSKAITFAGKLTSLGWSCPPFE
jgi:hypothetical protein